MESITCFKAYDVRGRVPDQLNEDIAWRIGRAYAEFIQPRSVVLGYDVRLTSPDLANAVAEGLNAAGVDAHEIGRCGTEEIYFSTAHFNMDGGIMVTASHNPKDYNGMKLVREESRPISADTGLEDIRRLAERNQFRTVSRRGQRMNLDHRHAYTGRLVSAVNAPNLKPLKIVANPGNGGAGDVVEALAPRLPFSFQKLQFEPDGHFPNGVPNPMLEENRELTAKAVRDSASDMGLAWDGDFDRCFFFDERGEYIEGYYIVGMLAEALLKKSPGASIVYDPRLTWNTRDIVRAAGGKAVQSKAGHAFIKECMRKVDGLYGGEMSAHHYFRDFAYCDSGMLPWLLVAELLSQEPRALSERVAERKRLYPVSGEINREVADASQALKEVEARYGSQAYTVDRMDGLGFEFDQWRFNLRPSNTEPVLRLNVEARGDKALMEEKTTEILELLDQFK